ncbi:MAG: Maf family protein [Hyphomicrobiaceae bacterium]|nr:Maf family protein [Hyphomicrobiaceae bacterium]
MAANGHEKLILASASPARAAMLTAAGLSFEIVPSTLDEDAMRSAMQVEDGEVEPQDVAEVLARAKAEEVSARNPGVTVIAADQVLALGDRIFSKADSMEAARAQLLDLRGKTHLLHSAVALARDGAVDWVRVETAEVTMRSFTATFLGRYMAMAGPKVLASVGGYHLEGPGVQLIERVSGDYFTVLGLPMFALLEELRNRNIIAS